jgi:DNA topoisomerase-1
MKLKRVKRESLALRRQRRGRGFALLDAGGAAVRDVETRERVKALGIPPAWTDVTIAAEANAHIQACGLDAAGRVQYIYHPVWAERRHLKRTRQLRLLAQALPRLRRHVSQDLSAEPGSKTLALAIAVALIDRTAMRVGRERYLVANGTRGAGTLYAHDVKVDGEQVCIGFPAKSGKTARYCFNDQRLADAIVGIKGLKGKRLLQLRGEDGAIRPLQTGEINAYLREISGVAVTAKDFRTLHASAMAGEVLARMEPAPGEKARRRQMAEATRQVASFLQNTPAVCRTSYIAPCLFRLFDGGRLAKVWAIEVVARSGLRQREARLAQVLGTS